MEQLLSQKLETTTSSAKFRFVTFCQRGQAQVGQSWLLSSAARPPLGICPARDSDRTSRVGGSWSFARESSYTSREGQSEVSLISESRITDFARVCERVVDIANLEEISKEIERFPGRNILSTAVSSCISATFFLTGTGGVGYTERQRNPPLKPRPASRRFVWSHRRRRKRRSRRAGRPSTHLRVS